MSRYRNFSDEALFLLLGEDDARALAEINDRYGELLYRLVYQKAGDQDAAKDVVQQLMINLWEKRSTISIRGNVVTYLSKAVHYASLNVLKKQATHDRIIEDYQRYIDQTVPGADAPLLEKEMQEALFRALALLPPRVREILELRLKTHLTNKEIGERLDIAEETVKSHVKRGVALLKKYFLINLLIIQHQGAYVQPPSSPHEWNGLPNTVEEISK